MRLQLQQLDVEPQDQIEPIRRRHADPAAVHRYYGECLGNHSRSPATVRAYEKARRQERLAERARKHRERLAMRED